MTVAGVMMGGLPGGLGSFGRPLGFIRPMARRGTGLPAEARACINCGATA